MMDGSRSRIYGTTGPQGGTRTLDSFSSGICYTTSNSTNGGYCHVITFGIGIPRPDFLNDATYLGMEYTNGFLCNLWTKVDFIWYWEDVRTQIPVRWNFFDGNNISHLLFIYLFIYIQ